MQQSFIHIRPCSCPPVTRPVPPPPVHSHFGMHSHATSARARARWSLSLARSLALTLSHTPTHTETHTRKHTHTHARTHTHKHTHARTHTHTHSLSLTHTPAIAQTHHNLFIRISGRDRLVSVLGFRGESLVPKRDSNSHGARPVRLIITMIEWIQTSRLSIKNIFLPQSATTSRHRAHWSLSLSLSCWGAASCQLQPTSASLSLHTTSTPPPKCPIFDE